MKLILKGITSDSYLQLNNALNISQYSFDLRPKSFNFTQALNIKKLIGSDSGERDFALLFENEKDFMVKELMKDIKVELVEGQYLYPEFSGITALEELEKLELDYFWHYQDNEKIKNIENTKFLKKIIFHHSDLEYLDSRGELHGFFQLFSQWSERITFEVQLEWNSNLILSLFDFFKIPMISFEITNQVEKSYQNPDFELIGSHIKNIQKLFIKESKSEYPNIK